MNIAIPKNNSPLVMPLDAGAHRTTKDEWEDWSDEEAVTPILDEIGEEPLITLAAEDEPRQNTLKPQSPIQTRATSVARQSLHKIKRLKSRQRQKAQNAEAGIKLETDMSKFRQQRQQHIAQQMRSSPGDRQSRTGKFVDAAALKALEGEPSSPSVGSFAWLKKRPKDGSSRSKKAGKNLKAPKAASPQDLSPNERPIMIGFEMPADSDVIISPETAVIDTPVDFFPGIKKSPKSPLQHQVVSAWSPDTDDERSLYRNSKAASSIYSLPRMVNAPPVPVLPANLRDKQKEARRTTIIATDDEYDDADTPVTLFEVSPVSPRKTPKAKGRERAPTDASSRSQGWWDQVTSPFGPSPVEPLPTSSKSPVNEAKEWWKQKDEKVAPTPKAISNNPGNIETQAGPSNEWWKNVDEKKATVGGITPLSQEPTGLNNAPQKKRPVQIFIHEPSTPPVASSSRMEAAPSRPETHAEKARILVEEDLAPTEEPPPYEPPSKQQMIRYRAVFPPGHHLNNVYPPSPGPVSPGLTRAMASQGAIGMSDVPLTPPPAVVRSQEIHIPEPPAGTFISGDHFLAVTGHGPRQKNERRRRRHEKEDAMARKAGGLWRGRGCIPLGGCYGRSGREGRKRRRVCLGICGGFLGLIILIIVLAVTLTRKAASAAAPYSPWLNLTDFPPIPTGVLTVVAPENSDAISGCVSPPSLWSCSLPKEQAPGNTPFAANQPKFIFQIQFDNSSRRLWDVTGQQPPRPTPNTNGQGTLQQQNQTLNGGNGNSTNGSVSGSIQGRVNARGPSRIITFLQRTLFGRDSQSFDPGFQPSPSPPAFQEMWFLGNTSDGIVSDEKAGEPTPFYITFMQSLDTPPIGPNRVTRRLLLNETVPAPALNPDGTGAPAVLLPRPFQQPLRLYDRGLPTEHYGFYTYFDKTIYAKGIEANAAVGNSAGVIESDQNGGALESEANFLVTWGMSRFKVEFWTRLDNSSRLLSAGPGIPGGNSTRPGTFPYPVAFTVDTHGGERLLKSTYAFNVTQDRHIDTSDLYVKVINYALNGEQINPAVLNNTSFGGFDGGTGGCKCVYKNFVGVTGRTVS